MLTDKRVPRMNSQIISGASLYTLSSRCQLQFPSTLSLVTPWYYVIYNCIEAVRIEYRIRTPKSATFQLVGARCIRQLHSNEQ
jgi:hypothetical protein